MAGELDLEDVLFSILIGSIPTASMLLASFALMNLKVPPLIEACFQNFCAGLILAAVSLELLPLMSPSSTTTPFHSVAGTTIGFILGVAMINGVSELIDGFENEAHDHVRKTSNVAKCDASCGMQPIVIESEPKIELDTKPIYEMSPNGSRRLPWVSSNIVAADRSVEMKDRGSKNESSKILTGSPKQFYGQGAYTPLNASTSSSHLESLDPDCAGCAEDGYDHEAILIAAVAIATPSHRAHIKEHFVEIKSAIVVLERNTSRLMMSNCALDLRQSEKLAEEIDEEIHMLQYRLDHTRR